MTRLALIAALVLGWTASAGAQITYRAPEGDFVIDFPMAPTVETRPAHRSHDVALRRYEDNENSRAFSVRIEEYPDNALPPSPNGATYDRLLRSYAGDDPTSLKSTRPARLSGRPCLEGVFVDMEGDTRVVRVLMLGERIYQVAYIHAEGADEPGVAEAYFGSFKITAP